MANDLRGQGTQPVALTIAGSDSGGGAGIQADLKVFHSFGVFGTSAITAITAQNTMGVRDVHVIPPAVVRSQIAAVAEDLPPAAFKTGMLANAEIVAAVTESISAHHLPNFVLDPVMVSTSGARLLDAGAERAIVEQLLPRCALVTPNLDEARLLTGRGIDDEDGMVAAAEDLIRLGASAALLKGGHLPGDIVVDILFDGRDLHRWERPRRHTRHTHGTGCALSAAIAAGLAAGEPLLRAVERGLDFVQRAIQTAPGLGAGHGPLNLFTTPAAGES